MATNDLRDLIEVVTKNLISHADTPAGGGIPDGLVRPDIPVSGEPIAPSVSRNADSQGNAAGLVIEQLVRRLADVRASAPSTAVEGATRSVQNSDGPDWLGQVGKTFVSGFGIASLYKGLLGGGEDKEMEEPLTRVQLPSSIAANVAYDAKSGTYAEASYDLNGMPRRTTNDQPMQVTVNVSAMDSKSFVDHSSEIARAVREAVLNSHALNDVLSEM